MGFQVASGAAQRQADSGFGHHANAGGRGQDHHDGRLTDALNHIGKKAML
jgi:hypothetical protein